MNLSPKTSRLETDARGDECTPADVTAPPRLLQDHRAQDNHPTTTALQPGPAHDAITTSNDVRSVLPFRGWYPTTVAPLSKAPAHLHVGAASDCCYSSSSAWATPRQNWPSYPSPCMRAPQNACAYLFSQMLAAVARCDARIEPAGLHTRQEGRFAERCRLECMRA